MTAFIRIAWIDRLPVVQVLRSHCASGRMIRQTRHVDQSGAFRSSQLPRSAGDMRPIWYRHPQTSGASTDDLNVLIHHGAQHRLEICPSEMHAHASRSTTTYHELLQLKSATSALPSKESTSHSKNVAVHPLCRDRFLAPECASDGLSHYRPPQPPVFAIDEHSSCIHRKRATAVLVVRNSASESGARRREGCRRVCILPDGAHAMLARRHAGMRVESV